jgi:ABC-type uncharacterized transport system substrate-binding protein
MIRITRIIFVIIIMLMFLTTGCSKEPSSLMSPQKAQAERSKKKVLFVDSYHRGYEWSDGVTEGVLDIFAAKLNEDDTTNNSESKVELRIFRMDTKRNTSEEFKQQAALKAKNVIESWRPDIVIASDDNAFKYLVMPYYKDADLPIVFCGLNWDASIYGAPYSNTAGMVEISLVRQLMEQLRRHSHGNRIGFLAGDTITPRKEAVYYKSLFNLDMTEIYVNNFEDWKKNYIDMQQNFDILILNNNAGINDWNKTEALELIHTHTIVPAGSTLDWMIDYSLLAYARIPAEQGEWSANAALEILNGKSPSDIPIVRNKKAKVYLNMEIARKLGVTFPMELINQAEFTK